MFHFVYWLKAFAAAFITNSHYMDIWPIRALAMGGHMGNCLFFLLSGFCLCNIRDRFPQWFGKRIFRIYPALWIVASIDFLAGRIQVDSLLALYHCLVYPTWYHFITSIMILYVVFYGIQWVRKKWKLPMEWFIGGILGVFLMVYVFCFDKSSYHIDSVYEKWVRYQFLLSMLLGVIMREKYAAISEKISIWHLMSLVLLAAAYFAGKKTVPHYALLRQCQILLPIIQVCLVGVVAWLAIKLEKRGFFTTLPDFWNRFVKFVSEVTLEIYLGQVLILDRFSGLPFPVNAVVVTGLILLYAWAVHKCAKWIGDKLTGLLIREKA